MKVLKNTSTSKAVAGSDNELRTLLMEDLRSFRIRNQFLNIKKVAILYTMSAA